MISSKFNFSAYFFYICVSAFLLTGCKRGVEDSEAKALNSKADSLSIKLNAPELKAVNAE
ncbi:MAG: hypothetical protein K0S12_869, partial [Bacteroidetes bacterium]|nr:hypothetical protein [Bacteroidota bacterium]